MAVKDITDVQVCLATECAAYLKDEAPMWCQGVPCAAEVLMDITGQCYKVCVQAIERASNRGYVDNGIREYMATLLPPGGQLIESHDKVRPPFAIRTANGVSKMDMLDEPV